MSQHRYLQQFLYQALGQPWGLLVSTDDPVRTQQKLYAAKYTSRDPALAGVEIKLSPVDGGELVIYDREKLRALLAPPESVQNQRSSREEALFDNLTLEDLGVKSEGNI